MLIVPQWFLLLCTKKAHLFRYTSLVWVLSGESTVVISCLLVHTVIRIMCINSFLQATKRSTKSRKKLKDGWKPTWHLPSYVSFRWTTVPNTTHCTIPLLHFFIHFLLMQNSPVCSRNARMIYSIICFSCGRLLQLLLISKMDLFSISPFNLTSSLWLTGHYNFPVCIIWC